LALLPHCGSGSEVAMKRLFSGFVLILMLVSCATFTLITVNADAESLLPADLKNGEFTASSTGSSVRLPSDTGGEVTGVTQFSVVDRARVLLVVSFAPVNVPTDVSLTLDLFIGPSSAADVFQTQYRISSTSVLFTPTTGTQASLDIALDPTGGNATALTALKSGNFKYGARIVTPTGVSGRINYQITNLDFSITGYPIRLIR
jgi:hypothetical protein